jgi:4-hydroxy-tetrahydrodipicolinate reductase
MLKITLNGSAGRMGCELAEIINNDRNNYELVGAITRSTPNVHRLEMLQSCDLVIDFSAAEATSQLVDLVESASNCSLMVGTTGLDKSCIERLKALAQNRAILYTENTSVSANIVAYYSGKMAKALADYDVEIIEAHHKHKKDAPSGTALMIGYEIAKARGQHLLQHSVFSRYHNGPREDSDIGFSSIRGGGISGEHKVMFIGEEEMVSLECRSFSRRLFALGALLAAKWLQSQPPGFYSMKDVLGLH